MDSLGKIKILADADYLTFEWAKKTVDAFRRYAVKNKYQLEVAFTPEKLQPQPGETIIVNGVDRIWLDTSIRNLKKYDAHILLLHGETLREVTGIDHVRVSQRSLMQASIAHLAACGRTETAFFGARKNDSSDMAKALCFREYFPEDNIWTIDNTVSNTFSHFLRQASNFDSVICANDIVAYCFLRCCREQGIRVPDDLYVVGNGDLWMSSRIEPSLTTATYDWEDMVKAAMAVIKADHSIPSIHSIKITLDATLVPRLSTGYPMIAPTEEENSQALSSALVEHRRISADSDPEMQLLQDFNQTLFCASSQQYSILHRLAQNDSYENIAKALVLSIDTVKYHIKKLYRQLGIHNRSELIKMLSTYALKI